VGAKLTFFVFGVWVLLGANPAFRYYLGWHIRKDEVKHCFTLTQEKIYDFLVAKARVVPDLAITPLTKRLQPCAAPSIFAAISASGNILFLQISTVVQIYSLKSR